MKINKIKSNAKLNLALNITGKKNALHRIESIIVKVNPIKNCAKVVDESSRSVNPSRSLM